MKSYTSIFSKRFSIRILYGNEKPLFYFLGIVILPQLSLGQTGINISTNAPRHADILYKIKAPFVDNGKRGEDAVWQLDEITGEGTDHLQLINSNGDSIAIYEEGCILHYLVREDTLFYKGMQSRRSHRVLSQERSLLHYPFQFGDSITGFFKGEGCYESIQYSISGLGYTVADGIGCLIYEEDTLRNVSRLHLLDDYVLDYGKKGTEHIQEERYQWYCAGYRYAVLESIVTSVYDGNNLIPIDSVFYLYLPAMQITLPEDLANDQILAELEANDSAIGQAWNSPPSGSLSQVDATLSSDCQSLTINYQLDASSDITFITCDVLGNILGSVQYQGKAVGNWQEYLTLSRRPIGGVLMLNIRCEEQFFSMKVVKE